MTRTRRARPRFAAAIVLAATVACGIASGVELTTLRGHRTAVADVAFSPDGKTLASMSTDGDTILWDISGGAGRRAAGLTRNLSAGERYLGYTHESPPMLLAGCSTQGFVIDPASGKAIAEWGDRAKLNDGAMIYAGGRNVAGWDAVVEPGKPAQVYAIEPGRSFAVSAVSPDGKRWFTNQKVPGDKHVQVLDAATGAVQCDLKSFTARVQDIGWIDASRTLTLIEGGEYGGSLMLWDVSGAGKLLAKVDLVGVSSYAASRLAVSADGRTAAVALKGAKVALISVGPRQLKIERTVDAALYSVGDSSFQLSDDGHALLAGGPSDSAIQVVVIDARSGSVLLAHTRKRDDLYPELSPDGRWVALGHADGSISLLPVSAVEAQDASGSMTQILDMPLDHPEAPKMPPGMRNLFRPFDDGRIQVSAAGDLFVLHQKERTSVAKAGARHLPVWFQDTLSPRAAELPAWALTKDGTFLVEGKWVGTDQVPKFFSGLVNPATGQYVLQRNSRSLRITAMRPTPNGSQMAIRGSQWSWDGRQRVEAPASLFLLDSATGNPVRTLAEGLDSATPCLMVFSQSGKRLAVLERWKLRVFETETGDEIPLAGEWSSTRFGLLDDGEILARQESGGSIVGVDLDTQAEAFRWKLSDGQTGAPTSIEFSADGKFAAVGGSTGDLTLRDLRTGAVLFRSKPFELPIGGLGFSPDGTIVAAADTERRLLAWKLGSLKPDPADEPAAEKREIRVAEPAAP